MTAPAGDLLHRGVFVVPQLLCEKLDHVCQSRVLIMNEVKAYLHICAPGVVIPFMAEGEVREGCMIGALVKGAVDEPCTICACAFGYSVASRYPCETEGVECWCWC